MKVNDYFIKMDQMCDLIPAISTCSNLINIFQKYAVFSRVDKEDLLKNKYFTYINNKTYLRCFVMMIPFAGIVFKLYESFKDCRTNKVLILPNEDFVTPPYCGSPENSTPSSLMSSAPSRQGQRSLFFSDPSTAAPKMKVISFFDDEGGDLCLNVSEELCAAREAAAPLSSGDLDKLYNEACERQQEAREHEFEGRAQQSDLAYKEAFHGFKIAADLGHIDAMSEVGQALIFGFGVPSNTLLAELYLKKAELGGNSFASLYFSNSGKGSQQNSPLNKKSIFKNCLIK